MRFSWIVFADRQNFDRSHYDFHYAHREFLGEVRCLVFDVTPKKGAGNGLFEGRIWVEDQDYNIVRLNGTYVPRPKNAFFFHMDSWRLNLVPGYWVPAYIYSEEGDFSYGSHDKLAFKAQSRICGYDQTKPAWEQSFRANWRTSFLGTISAASLRSMTVCCSRTNLRIRILASVIIRKKKLLRMPRQSSCSKIRLMPRSWDRGDSI